MITKQEIGDCAEKYGLEQNVIEKDYVLSWVLAGIVQSEILREQWVFKGGTCLKKCYFEQYRFSEDLDFTLLEPDNFEVAVFFAEFKTISDWVYQKSGVEFLQHDLVFEDYKNALGERSIQVKMSYLGPMGRRGSYPRIKLDLSCDEPLVCSPEWRAVSSVYSDETMGFKIKSYSLEEIFAEKLRALVQRLSPRDVYDVIRLYTYPMHTSFSRKIGTTRHT